MKLKDALLLLLIVFAAVLAANLVALKLAANQAQETLASTRAGGLFGILGALNRGQ